MEHKTSLGGWLKQRRKTLDLTQDVLACCARCSSVTIRKIEADRLHPSAQLIERLADALRISPTERSMIQQLTRSRRLSKVGAPMVSYHIHQLPLPATPLIGRADELASAQAMVLREDVRLLTLAGPPGVGKTRLGLQVAAEAAHAFVHGVCFVALASVREPQRVLTAIAQALGIRESKAQPLPDTLCSFLCDKQLFLILDNFEQVHAAARSVAQLLEHAPRLKIMATSRVALSVSHEHVFAVAPLAIPERQSDQPWQHLSKAPAVMLFAARARAVKQDFTIDSTNARVVVELCARLDGLPLAIELAAARINVLTPSSLLRYLDHHLDVLVNSAADVDERHRTLRRAIAWSYDLLSADDQRLFRQLSVFVGGWRLDAAAAVCGPPVPAAPELGGAPRHALPAVSFLDRLARLVQHNLIRQASDADGDPQFTMLETVRTFAETQLLGAGEVAQIRRCHAEYYLTMAETAAAHFIGPDQAQWLQCIEADHENIRAALAWLQTQPHQIELELRIVVALYPFWKLRGYLREGSAWLKAAIGHAAHVQSETLALAQAYASELAWQLDDYVQAEQSAAASLTSADLYGYTIAGAFAHMMYGKITYRHNDFTRARWYFETSLQLFRKGNAPGQLLPVLHDLAYLAVWQGDYPQALRYYEEERLLAQQLGYKSGIFWTLHGMGWVAERQGDVLRAAGLYKQCLALAREVEHTEGIALSLASLGEIAHWNKHYTRAETYYWESYALYQRLGYKAMLAMVLQKLGFVTLRKGHTAAAAAHFAESFGLAQEMSRTRSIAVCLAGLGSVAAQRGEYVQATRLLSMTTALFEATGCVLELMDRLDYDHYVALVRAQLGSAAFAAAWTDGRAITQDQAINEALAVVQAAVATRPAAYSVGLTRREAEVLRLIAQGMSTAQVAEQLVISPRTVNTHLTGIYTKLGVSSRTAAIRFAIDHNLV